MCYVKPQSKIILIEHSVMLCSSGYKSPRGLIAVSGFLLFLCADDFNGIFQT